MKKLKFFAFAFALAFAFEPLCFAEWTHHPHLSTTLPVSNQYSNTEDWSIEAIVRNYGKRLASALDGFQPDNTVAFDASAANSQGAVKYLLDIFHYQCRFSENLKSTPKIKHAFKTDLALSTAKVADVIGSDRGPTYGRSIDRTTFVQAVFNYFHSQNIKCAYMRIQPDESRPDFCKDYVIVAFHDHDSNSEIWCVVSSKSILKPTDTEKSTFKLSSGVFEPLDEYLLCKYALKPVTTHRIVPVQFFTYPGDRDTFKLDYMRPNFAVKLHSAP